MSLLAAKKKLLMAQKKGLRVQEVFNTSLWTGTGAARTITTGINSGEGSLVWTKNRVRTSGYLHNLQDTIRGTSSQLDTASSSGATNYNNQMTAFSASGYSLSSGAYVNQADDAYVGWQFRRAPKFFDIVQYTGNGVSGRSISHNLGIKPGLVVVKRLDDASQWQTYHQSQGATKVGFLNLNDAFTASPSSWANTEPTDSSFTVGNDFHTNGSGGTFIAYLFAHDPSPEGIIQCGSAAYNVSSGVTINLGWKPQYLLLKPNDGGQSWHVIDAARSNAVLYPNSSGSEWAGGGSYFTFTSTGFTIAPGVYSTAETPFVVIRQAA